MLLGSPAGKRDGQGERFSRPLTSLGVALVFLLLLFVLFPEKNIVENISRAPQSGSVALGYRQAMLRVRPTDLKLRLDLAEGLVETGQFGRALGVLEEIQGIPDGRERQRYRLLRYRALYGVLSLKTGNSATRKSMTDEFSRLVRELAETASAPSELSRMVTETKGLVDGATSSLLLRRYDAVRGSGEDWQGAVDVEYYRKNAQFCFTAMKEAKGLDQRRALFIKGVGFLRSGNLAAEALAAGEANFQGLATDRTALLFMTKTALAAGKPHIAERYIRMALHMGPERDRVSGK